MKIEIGKKLPQKEDLIKIHQKWDFWKASYRVDESYIDGYDARKEKIIKPFICETRRDYEDRKSRTNVRNYIGPIVQQYSSVVFRRSPERDEKFSSLVTNADGRGKSLDAVMQSSLEAAQIYGFGIILLENLVPGTTLSIAQAREAGVTQRVINVDNYSLINWTETDGYLIDCIINFVDENGNPFARLYTNEFIQDVFLDSKGKTVTGVGEPVSHGYSTIPVTFVRLPVAYDSFVQPLAQSQMGINNNLSLLSEEIIQNTFTRYVLSGIESFRSMSDEEKKAQEITWSSRRMLVLSDENVKVDRVASDKSQADSIRETITDETDELMRLAGMLEQTIGAGASGEARQISRDKFFIVASGFSKSVQNSENYIIGLYNELLGGEYNLTSYILDFETVNWQEEITELRDVLALKDDLPEELVSYAIEQFKTNYMTNQRD